MRWYRLDNIEVLPASESDLVDEDYLCPVVVYPKSRLQEEGWGPKPDDAVYGDVYIREGKYRADEEKSEGRLHYGLRYGNLSFYVTVDEEEITVDVSERAVLRLNEVLRERDETFRFEYDRNMLKADDSVIPLK